MRISKVGGEYHVHLPHVMASKHHTWCVDNVGPYQEVSLKDPVLPDDWSWYYKFGERILVFRDISAAILFKLRWTNIAPGKM